MRLGAGEILQRRTEAGGLDDSQVHLESAREPHRGAGVALRGDLCHFTELAEACDEVRRVGAADDDVEIADGLFAPAEAAGHLDGIDASACF